MTIKMIAASVGIAVAALAFPALAQGTAEQQQACTPDAMSLCGEHIPDAGRVKACLISKRTSLSPACRAAIAANDPKPAAPRKRRRKHA
ncbi:hypothetical protein [Methylobacterium sp. WSM2598]|uniref:hypothetical protein n=1 Tax=Methylobacterium sp. WSM2598 TaxID=398261 RepID=UPI000381230C|nr:hypothetical protein [Methylobacterium sp. WSM2598]